MQKNNNIFKQPCFIKKITTELKEKLKELGYKDVGKARYYGESQYIYCDGRIFYESPCTINARHKTFIDCGDNEELFLAIAAIRDDTDKHQWFVLDTRLGSINYPDSLIPKGSLMKCLGDNWNIDLLEDGTPSPLSSRNIPAHKASLEELVTAFNAKSL